MSIANAAHCSMMESAGGPTVCSYIQSDGSASIDTDFVPIQSQSFEVEFSCASFARCAFFGVANTDGAMISQGVFCGFYMAANDRRVSCRVRPDGGDWTYWNQTAYDGNEFWDGAFHTFSFPLNTIRGSFTVTVDGAYVLAIKNANYLGATGMPTSSLSIFGIKSQTDGIVYFVPPQSVGFKFKRLTFFDDQNAIIANLVAAKSGKEYGVLNTVTGVFSRGNGGTISGA